MQQVTSFFVFNELEIAGIVALILLLIITLYYYLGCYYKPLKYVQQRQKDQDSDTLLNSYPMVSVIIESENEAERLAANLPSILEQNYPNFEVVVVNKGSTDESDDVLQNLSTQYPNLYHTHVPLSYDKSLSSRKLALMIGIKAAKGDILLFTEAYSIPISPNWIMQMAQALVKENKKIALGYSYYKDSNTFFNRLARFDNLLFSMQYSSMALDNKPYVGVYRNIAFEKSLFFETKGFASCLGIIHGEELYIHRILNNENAVAVLTQDSFTETEIESYPLWRQIKKTYSYAQYNFEGLRSRIFRIEYIARYLFLILFLLLTIYACHKEHWGLLVITMLIFVVRLAVQLFVFNRLSTYFRSGKFYFSFVAMELLQPIYNLKFRSRQKKHRHK